jgi:regulatory protein
MNPPKPPKPRPEDAEEARNVREHALELLARREHSTAELTRKLEVYGHPAELVGNTLKDLARSGELSDARFAESFMTNRVERGSGPLKIRAELRERGVDDEVIEAALTSEVHDWTALAAEARAKHFGAVVSESYAERGKQARFLRGRGFSGEQIKQALDKDGEQA